MVSVVLPTYNREKSLGKSIESVLNQTYQDFELIIVDDGSSDNSKELIQKYFEKDPRINYVYEENAGYPSAINRGLIECKGEYIAFEDSDDIWDNSKLEKELTSLNDNNADYVFCRMEYKDLALQFPNEQAEDKNGDIFQRLLQGNMIGGPTLLFKHECINNIGGFDTNLPSFQDYDFVLRLSQKYKAAFVPEVLLYCGSGNDNMQGENVTYFKASLMILEKYKYYYKKYPISTAKYLNTLFTNADKFGIRKEVEKIVNDIMTN